MNRRDIIKLGGVVMFGAASKAAGQELLPNPAEGMVEWGKLVTDLVTFIKKQPVDSDATKAMVLPPWAKPHNVSAAWADDAPDMSLIIERILDPHVNHGMLLQALYDQVWDRIAFDCPGDCVRQVYPIAFDSTKPTDYIPPVRTVTDNHVLDIGQLQHVNASLGLFFVSAIQGIRQVLVEQLQKVRRPGACYHFSYEKPKVYCQRRAYMFEVMVWTHALAVSVPPTHPLPQSVTIPDTYRTKLTFHTA